MKHCSSLAFLPAQMLFAAQPWYPTVPVTTLSINTADQCLSTLDPATEQALETPDSQRCCDLSHPCWPCISAACAGHLKSGLWNWMWWKSLCSQGNLSLFPFLIDLQIALISYRSHLCHGKDREVRWYWVMDLVGSLHWDLEWRCCLKQWLCNLGCFHSGEWWGWGKVSR